MEGGGMKGEGDGGAKEGKKVLSRKASGVPQKCSSTQTHPVLIFVIFLACKNPAVGRTVSPLMVFWDWLSCPLRWLPPLP